MRQLRPPQSTVETSAMSRERKYVLCREDDIKPQGAQTITSICDGSRLAERQFERLTLAMINNQSFSKERRLGSPFESSQPSAQAICTESTGPDIRRPSLIRQIKSDLRLYIIDGVILDDRHANFERESRIVRQFASDPRVERKEQPPGLSSDRIA
jgi:hypothetical protein